MTGARWAGAVVATRFLGHLLLASSMIGPALAEAPAGVAERSHERVVSIGGSITEIVYALGAERDLVAVDSTSRYPPQAASLANVGYMRQLSAEPIIALAPTLVLAEADAGPPLVLDQIRTAGIRLVTVPDEPSPQGVLDKVSRVARALGRHAEGAALVARLESEFATLRGALSTIARRPAVLFLLSIGSGAPLAAGTGTAAAAIIDLAGGRNAITSFEGFKPIAPEAIAATGPDVILVSERTLSILGGREGLLARPEIALTPAGRRGRVISMDGLLLLGFGPRTGLAIRQLAMALHPALSLAPAGD